MKEKIYLKEIRRSGEQRGVVVGLVKGSTLRIGYSLCNKKMGDRWDPEIAESLATGRALVSRSQYKADQAPSRKKLMEKGVPQSSIDGIGQIVKKAKEDDKIQEILIFTSPKAGNRIRRISSKAW